MNTPTQTRPFLALALAAPLFATPPAPADTRYFDDTRTGCDGSSNDADCWHDGTGKAVSLPGPCDDVVYATSAKLTADLSVGSFTLNANVILYLDDNAGTGSTLTVKGCGRSQISTLNTGAKILLRESTSELKFVEKDHIVIGSGAIEGSNAAAAVKIADPGKVLLSKVDITGFLILTGSGDFINAGTVEANAAGTLEVDVSGSIVDLANGGPVSSSNFRWGVTHAGGVLLFDAEPGGLSGHFYVAAGDLQAGAGTDDIDVATTGDLLMLGGEIITGVNDSFCFSQGCPP